MIDLQLAADSFPIWKAILWCFYPMGALLAVEVFLRSVNDDDDDDEGGGIMNTCISRNVMDWNHSYWKYAELVNGRLAMVGVIILIIKCLS